MSRFNSRLSYPLSILALLAALGGCTPLPDATPFRESTLQLRSAMDAGYVAVYKAVSASEALDASEVSDKDADSLKEAVDKLKKARESRLKAANSMVDYAERIKALTDAGNKGNETVARVAEWVNLLAAFVPLAPDAAMEIKKQIDKIRASSTLAEALQQAQPAVLTVAELVAKDVDDMIDTLHDVTELDKALIMLANEDKLGKRSQVLEEKGKILKESRCESDNGEKVRDCIAFKIARLEFKDHVLKHMDEWYLPLQAKLEAIRDRKTVGRNLLAATGQAVLDWASAHRQLALAIQKGGRVDPKALAESIVEIRDLIRRVREL